MPSALAAALVVAGAYLLAGLFHLVQRASRDPSHPGALARPGLGRAAAVLLTWLPACLRASLRYARAGWRPALAYFAADAGAPLGLFLAILAIVFLSR